MALAQVPQGTLNRLKASVVFGNVLVGSNQPLTITAAYLGTEGIRLALDSNATDLLPTMTGMVSSPAPYQSCTLTMAIVKSTTMANQLLQKMQTDTTIIGPVTVYPDVDPSILQPFSLFNMALETVREMNFAGTEPVIVFTMRGYIQVNQGFFNA